MSGPVEVIEPRPDFKRESRFGRPMIVPPEGGDPKAYTRVTTFVGAAEDMFNVQKWEKRQVAIGLAERPDLLLSVAAHRDDKEHLNRLCDEAKEAAAASAAATTGTALHSLTELVDQGRKLPTLPESARASLEAYRAATAELKPVAIEAHLVHDPFKVAGTTDRILDYGGTRYIADIKTGSIELGINKIAGQLALYARSRPYDVIREERLEAHGASNEIGLIIWLPASEPGRCELVWVDLLAGWEWVKLCRATREMRGRRFKQLTEPFRFGELPTFAKPEPVRPEPLRLAEQPLTIRDLIDRAGTPEAVRAIWAAHKHEWTEELTAYGAAHVNALEDARRRGRKALA